MASVELTWDNTFWKWHWFGWSSVPSSMHASWPVWLVYAHIFQPIPALWMSSHSSRVLAQLASHRGLGREGWYPNTSVWVQAGWLSNPPLVWVHTSRSKAGAGKGIDREMGLERWCFSSKLSHRNSGRWGMSSNPLPSYMVVAPLFYWMEAASTNAACLKGNGQKQFSQRKCPYPDKVHGTFP